MFCFCCWQFCSFLFLHRIFLDIDLHSIKEENVGIYRWYIVYRKTSTRYFVEKNSWKSTKNRQYIANISTSEKNDQKGIKSPIFQPVNALQGTLKNAFFLCCWRDLNPKQKVWGSTHQTTRASLPFVNVVHLKYIFKVIM